MLYPFVVGGFIILLYEIHQIKQSQEKQMSQLDDLNKAIDTLSADLTDVATNVSNVLDELKAAQSAGTGVSSEQLTALIAKVTTADEALKTIDQNLKDAQPGA